KDWDHFCIPMEYDWPRTCVTSLGWVDPRAADDDGREPLVVIGESGERMARDDEALGVLNERQGELMWPERFGRAEVAELKSSLGPYMASGRLQQSPQPKGG